MVTIIVPMTTRRQFTLSERRISDVVGRCLRAANFSVSWSDRLSRNRNGMITQPRSNGTRHPHTLIFSGGRVELRRTPTNAANMTATCWLPDCQLDRKSTRLNSSHGYISYAVFCLKKKKKKQNRIRQETKKQKKKYANTH